MGVDGRPAYKNILYFVFSLEQVREIELRRNCSIKIRNGTWETGNGIFDLSDLGWVIDDWPEPKHYECELTESDFLPSISFEKLRLWEFSWADREWLSAFYQLWKVSGGWVQWDYNVSSAPFVSEFRLWELSIEIWAEMSRSRAWQFRKTPKKRLLLR